MTAVRYPTLYQINTRTWLNELSRQAQRPVSLEDVPDVELDRIASLGFDWVWLLGVWQTGAAGRNLSLSNPDWRRGYQEVLPDLSDEDIAGSCFAICDYAVSCELGGNTALAHLRQRLWQRGLRLMLDFVPNHTALDHPWAFSQPEYYIQGEIDDLRREPENYIQVESIHGSRILARGRDPFFPGWLDTLQLNYGNARLQNAMLAELLRIARICDGVRCDMAMLVLPEVFQRTWGILPKPFWPRAISSVRQENPGFIFMAEVYWGMEGELLRQGFDYTYDKQLYDHLKGYNAQMVRQHLQADLSIQEKMVRFLENHDETRAAEAFPPGVHQAAALLTFLSPGLRFFHQGQLEGFRRRVPVQLSRSPVAQVDAQVQVFYTNLLEMLREPALAEGSWQLLECSPAWEGNNGWKNMIVYWWKTGNQKRRMVVVNYAPEQSQCYVRLPEDVLGHQGSPNLDEQQSFINLYDRLSQVVYQREKEHLYSQGLYIDLPAWGSHIFDIDF